MKVKSYYAATVESAMAQASREMGPDAVLITSRRTGAEAQHLGAYEVVFGSTGDEPAVAPARGDQPVREARPGKAVETHSSELDALRQEMTLMRRAIRSACRNASSQQWLPELSEADALLTEADIPAELREDILEALDLKLRDGMLYDQARFGNVARRARSKGGDNGSMSVSARALTLLREQCDSLLEVAPGLEPQPGNARSVIALVGPSGAGKSITVLKLAIQYGLAARRSVHVISTDFYRAGSTEQLRVCCAAIGVGLQVVDSPWALGQALEEQRNKKLVLIDTAGAARSDMDAQAGIAAFIAQNAEIETHLVLPATSSSGALAKSVKQFSCYTPSKTIITKLDEASSLGAAVGRSILAGLPVSFTTNGQHAPEDLVPASKPMLLAFLNEIEGKSSSLLGNAVVSAA